MKFWTRIEQFFKHRLLRFFETFLGQSQIDPEQLDHVPIKSILVIRTHDQLGDFLLSTPVFKALNEKFSDSWITVIAHAYTTPLVQNHPYVNAVLTFHEDFRNWSFPYAFHLFKGLYKKYDLVVVLNTVSHSLTSDLIASFTRAPYVLGTDHLLFAGTRRNFFYNFVAPIHKESTRHQTRRNLDIVRYIGADTFDLREYMYITKQERNAAKTILNKLGIDLNKKILAIHPGAGKIKNRWPVDNYAALAVKCLDELDLQIFITWGPSEAELGHSLLSGIDRKTYHATFPHIRELAAVLSLMDCFICNDTGVMHLCAAVGTPLVAIFGPTDPSQWKPWGQAFIAVQSASRNCAHVSVDVVYKECKRLLKKS